MVSVRDTIEAMIVSWVPPQPATVLVGTGDSFLSPSENEPLKTLELENAIKVLFFTPRLCIMDELKETLGDSSELGICNSPNVI